jgi:Capsule assembly protein Wzi
VPGGFLIGYVSNKGRFCGLRSSPATFVRVPQQCSTTRVTEPALVFIWASLLVLGATLQLLAVPVCASTYVVYVPLDSPIYNELQTLDGLGYLDTYFDEIKPLSRVEVARLTLEADRNLNEADHKDVLADSLIHTLQEQVRDEIVWLESNSEDNLPTIVHPLDRAEAEYVYSTGSRRRWQSGPNGPINATEGTPLFPNDDGLPTGSGSNEIARLSGWTGLGGFITGYAEGAFSGPLTRGVSGASRGQLLGAEGVVSLGNTAISFGQQEHWWGTGQFAALSQSDNAKPFPALSVENIHPKYLPWIFRYLGPGRRELFMGQLDADRALSQHPWIVGHVLVFKPLPFFEFGLTRTIIFGGRNNDHYSWSGFVGRFTGIATGNPAHGNTKSRAGGFFKIRVPQFRNLELYQEFLGSDNLTNEVPVLGHYMPFLSVAYEGGFYLPRLTADGLTDLRFEYALIPGSYSVQNGNSLYSTYGSQLFGDALGPNASRADLQVGHWFHVGRRSLPISQGAARTKSAAPTPLRVSIDFFYTEEAPALSEGASRFTFPSPSAFYPYALTKEHSFGMAVDLLSLPAPPDTVSPWLARIHGLLGGHARVVVEYTDSLNYQPHAHSVRAMVLLSSSLNKVLPGFTWR